VEMFAIIHFGNCYHTYLLTHSMEQDIIHVTQLVKT